ncbi:hypothetical protein CH380_11875 [Leptospira adleri]|uniref:Uncharacterized protein n=1 Tax=Leptospira adleri TaxID=2023186 RepID=A0A2M9YNH7_9LEPT|nr:hypothetical protein CH380_11875 [Leptospira adleri]PJZ62104.1 hypothetical protein CH376_09975 [Leptospira adleri]
MEDFFPALPNNYFRKILPFRNGVEEFSIFLISFNSFEKKNSPSILPSSSYLNFSFHFFRFFFSESNRREGTVFILKGF